MGLMVMLLLVLAPVLVFRPRGGVAAGLLHAATVLLSGVKRRTLPPEVVLVQLALAVVQKPAGLLCDVQIIDLQRGAGGRGALGLRVQRGRGRRQRALPPDISPLSAAAVSLRQFPKHTPRRHRDVFATLPVRLRGVCVLRREVALVVKVVVDAGVCSKSLRGLPNVHPQGIGRSLLLRLDPSGPGIHWTRVSRENLFTGKMASNLAKERLCTQENK